MTRICRRLLATILASVALMLATQPFALAHDVNMPVLQLQELQPGRFMMLWTIRPTGGELAPAYPPQCQQVEVSILDCGPDGLVGEVGLAGLGASQSAAILRIVYRNGAMQVFTLTADQPVTEIVASAGAESLRDWLRITSAYVAIGIEHILLGVDHLMFVFGLIWIVRARWMLVKTITSFTVAHSVTLAAVTFGWVGVPESAVNATIALSIVFVGVEMLKLRRGEGGWASRHPWMVAFAFGLLHGFGFANALVKLGLPSSILPLGLLAFNVGVEIGQLGFVLLVLAMLWAFRTLQVRWPRWSEPVPAYAIGSIAAFWLIGRMSILVTTS